MKLDITLAAETLLNGALDEDTLDDGWVSITILITLHFLNGV